jgi:hypothetical protein
MHKFHLVVTSTSVLVSNFFYVLPPLSWVLAQIFDIEAIIKYADYSFAC